jgi:hypothetical protein
MMALPYTYKNIQAPADTVVRVSISDDAGGDWFLTKKENWVLSKENILPVSVHTTIDGAIAWKLFTKSWRRNDVLQYITIEGEAVLGEPVLDMIAVMA